MEDLNKLKTNYEIMSEKIKNIIDCNLRLEGKIDAYIKEDRDWKERLDEKYAGKWTEKLSIAILGGIIVGLVLLVVGGL
jgi:predicted nuclease with TOPRIM domain